MTTTNSHKVVVTGIGAVTAGGTDWAATCRALLDDGVGTLPLGEVPNFRPAKQVKDRRMLKAMSKADGVGLAALESAADHANLGAASYAAGRKGVYVGSPPALVADNDYYGDAMDESRDLQSQADVGKFGATCMSSRPTTLLIGLPNNVLCYGALSLEAKGPNDNYVSGDTGGHVALVNGWRRVRRGQLDAAVVGGFNLHTDQVHTHMWTHLNVLNRNLAQPKPYQDGDHATVMSDAGVFLTLESADKAQERGAQPLATIESMVLTNSSQEPEVVEAEGQALEDAIVRALDQAGLEPGDIGLVLTTACGLSLVDRCELLVLSRVFAKERGYPALGYSTGKLGYLMEAGGLLEVGLSNELHQRGSVPAGLRSEGEWEDLQQFPREIPADKKYTMILRTGPWGCHSCLIVSHGG